MKKILCFLAILVFSVQMLLAVPAGAYEDDRGKRKVIIEYDGTINCLDSNGNVTSRWKVVREDANGRFYTKLIVNGQPYGSEHSDNAWWNENGKIYLNLSNQTRTLVRE